VAKEKWIGKIVKFKSGKIGMILEYSIYDRTVFLNVLVSGQGIISIRAKDVEFL